MSRRTALLGLVVLLTLAGCSGFSGGDSAPDREAYAVDDRINASIETEPRELLPGLTTEGVTDPGALFAAHQEVIDNRTYTVEGSYEQGIPSQNGTFELAMEYETFVDPQAGTLRRTTDRRTEGEAPSPGYATVTNGTNDQWIDDEQVVRSEYENGSVEYLRFSVSEFDPIEGASRPIVLPLNLGTEATTEGRVDAEDGTYYVLNVTANESGEAYGQTAESVDGRLLVREDGLIRQSTLERSTGEGDERSHHNRTTMITGIDETAVERPGWYEEAMAEAPEPDEPDGPSVEINESANATAEGASSG